MILMQYCLFPADATLSKVPLALTCFPVLSNLRRKITAVFPDIKGQQSLQYLFNLKGVHAFCRALHLCERPGMTAFLPVSQEQPALFARFPTSGCVNMCPFSGPACQPVSDNYSLVFISVRCWLVRGSC